MSLFRLDISTKSHKKSKEETQGKFLWQDAYYQMRIKDFLPAQASLCKYIWEVIICIMITNEEQVGLDIWLKTPNQDAGIEDIIITT